MVVRRVCCAETATLENNSRPIDNLNHGNPQNLRQFVNDCIHNSGSLFELHSINNYPFSPGGLIKAINNYYEF